MQRALFLAALLSPALVSAQEATDAASPTSQFASFVPLLLIFAVFYFALIRPQQKKMKAHQAMLGELKKGDDVVTGGGIFGKITKIDSDGQALTVEIAKGVEVRVQKASVSAVLGKELIPAATTEKKKSANTKNDNRVPSRDSIANDN